MQCLMSLLQWDTWDDCTDARIPWLLQETVGVQLVNHLACHRDVEACSWVKAAFHNIGKISTRAKQADRVFNYFPISSNHVVFPQLQVLGSSSIVYVIQLNWGPIYSVPTMQKGNKIR